MLIVNFLYIIFINNFFTPAKNIDDSDLPQYLSEIIGQNMKTILSTKFKYYSILFWQTIITFIVIILLIIYMANNTNEQSIYVPILIFLFLIFINGIVICTLNIRYFIYRLKSIYDDDFSQKENYLFNYIIKETYKGNVFSNITNILKEDFSSFIKLEVQLNSQVGGGEHNIKENNIYHNNLVPGPINDEESLKIYKNKTSLDKISFFKFYKLFDPSVISIIYEKFKDNKSWTTNGYILISIIILFFIIGILFQLKYISTGNNSLLKIIVSSIVLSCLYLPVILLIISLGYYFVIDNRLQIAVIIITVIGLIIALFIPGGIVGDKKKNWLNNIPFWICISFFIISILLVIIGKYTKKNLSNSKESINSLLPFSEPSAPSMNEYYEVLKTKLDEEENKRILYQSELEKLYLIDEIKDKKINELMQKQDNYTSTGNSDEYAEKERISPEILSLEKKIKNLKDELSNTVDKSEKLLLEEQIENLKLQLKTLKETLNKIDNNYIKNLENEILLLKDKLHEYNEKSILDNKNPNNINKYLEEQIESLKKKISNTGNQTEKESLTKKIENFEKLLKNKNEEISSLGNKINKLQKNLTNYDKNSSLLLLKDIKDEQKEKEIFLKSSIEYYIDDLRNHIEKILENARLFKLYTVSANLLYTLKIIDKFKKIEERRSDINYNDEILRILNKLKKINPLEDINEDFNEEFKTDLKRLNNIKNNSLYKDFEKELSLITLKIKNIANKIKEIVVKVK